MWPMLLDTCALQHLKFASELLEGEHLGEDEVDSITTRFGLRLGREMVALAELLDVFSRNGPAWLVSETSLLEFERAYGAKGKALRAWWHEWSHYMRGCIEADWYPEIEAEGLLVPRGPAVHERQLALAIVPPRSPLSAECVPTFAPFRDPGDRALIRDAIRAGVPSILTTDIDSFWRHRARLSTFGIRVLRPTELAGVLYPVAA